MGVKPSLWIEWFQATSVRRWVNWIGMAIGALIVGVLLLPVVRRYPEGVHTYFAAQPVALRSVACFIIILGFVAILFKLLSPHWAHLQKDILWKYPPYWSAIALATVTICLVDLLFGLGPNEFKATLWEWLGYVGGAVAIVGAYRWLYTPNESPLPSPIPEETVEGLVRDWLRLESWLQREVAAEDDLLGNRRVAHRLTDYLFAEGGTVGLVGPFGSGKSSVVKWLMDEVARRNQYSQQRVWICEVNCWGFEDSTSAIQHILSRAVETVGRHIDCFSVRHLPEAYRKTFSAGGDWVRNLADLMLGSADPGEQFQSLSDVLRIGNARLVIVVEDLDRTNSTRFDRQEVLALLQRVKMTDWLTFFLTGGRSLNTTEANNRIDFARLCDHIELLQTIEPRQVEMIVKAVRDRCLTAFPEDINTHPAEDPWQERTLALVWFDVLPQAAALAQLLQTPRGLKHALRRTYQFWERIHGEVDFDHLLAVNVLREGAPEAFDYLLRNWEHLRRDPRPQREHGLPGNRVAERLRNEWSQVIADVEWDARSVETLLEFILPHGAHYFRNEQDRHLPTQFRIQGITERDGRYWRRILNREIACTEIEDQIVLRQMQQWQNDRNSSSPLIEGIVAHEDNAGGWEHLSGGWDGALLLCLADQVIARYRDRLGTRRSIQDMPNFPPFAFGVLWRQAHRRVYRDETALAWLEEQIRRAVPHSLMLVVDLYYYWASPRNGIIRLEDRGRVRQLILQLIRTQCPTLDSLLEVTHPGPSDLHALVYPWGDDEDHIASECRGPEYWGWLGPILLDGLRRGEPFIAAKVGRLIAESREGVHPGVLVYEACPDRLRAFFGADVIEVIHLLALVRERLVGRERELTDQVDVSAENAFPTAPV